MTIDMRLELFNNERRVLLRDIDRELFLVGSNSECHLCVPDESIADIQCLLRREGNRLILANRSSRGTRVGGQTVMEELRLADDDTIFLGPVHARVCFQTNHDVSAPTRTLVQKAAMNEAFELVLLSVDERWSIDHEGLTLGTASSNDVVLDDPYASSVHAHLAVESGRVILRDLQSRNGVFVDGAKIGLAEIRDGATLWVGKTRFRIRRIDAESEALPAYPCDMLSAWVGQSSVSQRVRTLIARLAKNDAPVLITGETGTGKEVTAQLIHRASARSNASFVAINCGALSPNLIESELFGHEKGAFTGATGRQLGAFESANGGTLFLDEIGELPEDLQPQLLRVLEMNEIRRVGAASPTPVDVRIIAATNRDLFAAIDSGCFREDLYHRLAVLGIDLPALRDRIADIAELARHFIQDVLPPGEFVALTGEAVQKLETHSWSGNVRELRNVIQRSILMRSSDTLGPEDLSFSLNTLGGLVSARSQLSSRRLVDVERDAIVDELVRQRGNRTQAAEALGISRSTLHRKMSDYNIDIAAIVRDPSRDESVRVRGRRKRR